MPLGLRGKISKVYLPYSERLQIIVSFCKPDPNYRHVDVSIRHITIPRHQDDHLSLSDPADIHKSTEQKPLRAKDPKDTARSDRRANLGQLI